MLDSQKWFTISLSKEQVGAGVECAINDRLLKVILLSGFPPELVFYSKPPMLGQSSFPVVFFLPPTTAAVCQDLISDYPWKECDAPDLSKLTVLPGDQ